MNTVWFVLGPSGVGKTAFGDWLATECDWLHLEIDHFPNGDGIDHHNLRAVWEEFYSKCGSAQPLRQALGDRMQVHGKMFCVLTFPGNLLLNSDRINAARQSGIRTIYLCGSERQCSKQFLDRERQSGRILPLAHWISNNSGVFAALGQPALASYRIEVFTPHGSRRSHDEVFKTLTAQSDW